ncbi:uncharacterized protein PHALS_07573 [Plasmopara halstedii]|uniref:Uncharacterized protein n=1 Tax=Plasmopara halstedii TaxID=4781 RepID=A0A0P1B6Y8_PLAHL|nr:uncharacterized protein PHALS_07573 [Plasmopara halstedii]CEG49832.1 hypothetical protein PHALS_07573 [Plasmopara halstedii]|eukprot:XP_024586201.1 hypothetical protein PHALS_07573 [Plasmopara halstedii]
MTKGRSDRSPKIRILGVCSTIVSISCGLLWRFRLELLDSCCVVVIFDRFDEPRQRFDQVLTWFVFSYGVTIEIAGVTLPAFVLEIRFDILLSVDTGYQLKGKIRS